MSWSIKFFIINTTLTLTFLATIETFSSLMISIILLFIITVIFISITLTFLSKVAKHKTIRTTKTKLNTCGSARLTYTVSVIS